MRDRLYLTGGTALSAFYLRHRQSEDLDFFSEEDVGIEEVLHVVRSAPAIQDVQYERKYDRKIFLLRYPQARVLKVEFTTYPFRRCEEGPVVEGVQVDSLRDILVNKVMALTDRRDAKDYVDLYFAFKKWSTLDFDRLIEDSEAKFGVRGIQHILRGRFMEGPPSLGVLRMVEAFDPESLTDFFTKQARQWIARSLEES
jgi:predicted nucleotidyltransferase component of viral defense system